MQSVFWQRLVWNGVWGCAEGAGGAAGSNGDEGDGGSEEDGVADAGGGACSDDRFLGEGMQAVGECASCGEAQGVEERP